MIIMTVQPQSPRKPGPPPTGKGTPIQVRLQPDQLAALDRWIAENDATLTRPAAIRIVLAKGMS